MSTILYGDSVAKKIKQQLKEEIDMLMKQGKRIPHLVVLLVGSHPASVSYIRGKQKACQEIGMRSTLITLEEETTQEEVLAKIQELNQDEDVDGLLVQLPLPAHVDEKAIFEAVDPQKDVDGFHPYNMGRCMMGNTSIVPCTPKGVMKLLDTINYEDLSGKYAVVIGRSEIVGKPVGQLLLKRHATVTMCHSKTKALKEIVKQADVVVVAIGKAKMITADWIKEGAVVIDVGINRHEEYGLCGDVDFESVFEKTTYITPVPRGVGVMTVAMLLENTMECYKQRRG